LRKAVAVEPVRSAEGAVRVTLSLGVTTSKICGSDLLEAGIRAADVALYEAKAKGRNCAVLARSAQPNVATA
jgi:PleD family two-component response regulator